MANYSSKKTKGKAGPVRSIIAFLLGLGLLYGLAALGKDWSPELGLDLSGGTRITLVAQDNGDAAVTESQMNEAVKIIDRRANGSGISEASVARQGNRNIVVEIPGASRNDLVDSITRTAQLRFRLVANCSFMSGPCVANGRPAKQTKKTTKKNTKTKKTVTKKQQTAKNSKKKASAKSKAKKQAKQNPRVAPSSLKPKPKKTTQPTPKPTKTPASTINPVATQLAWADNPGNDWLAKFVTAKCPKGNQGANLTPDDPAKPMIACDEDGNKHLLSANVISGTELSDASFGVPQNSTAWAVNLSFDSKGTDTFAKVTKALNGTGKLFAIVLDGEVLSAPTVNSPILDGNAEISGNFTQTSAANLANSLKFGALPVKFADPPSVETVGPSLAGNQLKAGIIAGIIGLAIVAIYCLLYYRGLGVVVVASLAMAGAITYAAVLLLAKTAGFTLTLPGIAGLIVAIGITADSFIVYFERIRDEMRAGKTMRVAVESGWERARNTCLAADAVSLLAAVILYFFAIGVVKGFAFALGLTTLIDLAVFFWFTKPVMTWLGRFSFFNSGHRLSGLSAETLGIDQTVKGGANG